MAETAMGTRDRFLDAAARLVLARGYEGTSLNGILETSGAPRGSLYHHFPGGKDELIIEATRRTVDYITGFMRDCFAPGRPPVDAVDEYFRGAARELEESDFVFGCPVAPLVLDAVDQELELLCRAAFDEWQGIVDDHLRGAGIPAGRAAALASLLISTAEGALLLARARRDPSPVLEAGREIASVVERELVG